VLPWYDRIVALSPKHAEYVVRQGRIERARIVVINNGVDTERFRPAGSPDQRARVRHSLGLDADTYTVTIVAALRPEKNHGMFLRAAREFRMNGGAGVFLVVGGGEEARKLHALATELGLEDTVRFTGPREDIADILAASDVSVLCSHPVVETFPLSVLEAMAAALPVVVTPVGSIPEMITDGVQGITVPTGDVAALAGTLLDLERNPERRRKMGERARELVVAQYSEARMVEAYAELFRELTGGGAKGQV
jgi:glycosyltransferase involved in cell wall biosynthesis